jgi:hypothetical protein
MTSKMRLCVLILTTALFLLGAETAQAVGQVNQKVNESFLNSQAALSSIDQALGVIKEAGTACASTAKASLDAAIQASSSVIALATAKAGLLQAQRVIEKLTGNLEEIHAEAKRIADTHAILAPKTLISAYWYNVDVTAKVRMHLIHGSLVFPDSTDPHLANVLFSNPHPGEFKTLVATWVDEKGEVRSKAFGQVELQHDGGCKFWSE